MSNEEFKAAFLTAIRAGGAERERAFVFFETKLADSFKGEPGLQFYEDFLALVEEADPRAMDEARKRFFPLIDQKLFGKKALSAFADALPGYVESRTKEVEVKGLIADFLTGADDLEDNQLYPFVARFLETIEPHLRVSLVVFLLGLVTQKK